MMKLLKLLSVVIAIGSLSACSGFTLEEKIHLDNGVTRTDVPKYQATLLDSESLHIISAQTSPINVTTDVKRCPNSHLLCASDQNGFEGFYKIGEANNIVESKEVAVVVTAIFLLMALAIAFNATRIIVSL